MMVSGNIVLQMPMDTIDALMGKNGNMEIGMKMMEHLTTH
jgi:hypothetical protein